MRASVDVRCHRWFAHLRSRRVTQRYNIGSVCARRVCDVKRSECAVVRLTGGEAIPMGASVEVRPLRRGAVGAARVRSEGEGEGKDAQGPPFACP